VKSAESQGGVIGGTRDETVVLSHRYFLNLRISTSHFITVSRREKNRVLAWAKSGFGRLVGEPFYLWGFQEGLMAARFGLSIAKKGVL
jgi:hypothetical protein